MITPHLVPPDFRWNEDNARSLEKKINSLKPGG